ncbi:cytochrome C oxidase subunit IV family protein [Nocardia sp. NPDC050630]|uniref:cytochrome C oxidase subunit IV family protein n=1 Tax=Nocardia sp. NPDC050630 TaxID=3364321 RepID=UPI0037A05A7F
MTTRTATDKTRIRHSKRIIIYAWIALTAITLLAWQLAPGHADTTRLDTGLIIAVVVLGLIKCRLIIRYFMEIRHAATWLKIATDTWLAVIWTTMLAIYLY